VYGKQLVDLNSEHMTNRTLSLVLFIVAFLLLGYAIYRSTAEKITLSEGPRSTVYGEPQHGLILGLCVVAGICIASAVRLLARRPEQREVRVEERTALSKRPL
jgi:hypothetical protein